VVKLTKSVKSYVLDTSALVNDPEIITQFIIDGKVVLCNRVISELDNLKSISGKTGYQARQCIRNIYDLVFIKQNPNIIFQNTEIDNKVLNDDVILFCAKETKSILVSSDLNMLLKAKMLGLESINSTDLTTIHTFYTGKSTEMVSDSIVDEVYAQGFVLKNRVSKHLLLNQYVTLQSSTGKSALCKVVKNKVVKIRTIESVWGISPRSSEQYFAIDALLDPTIPLVSLIGPAGTGKTLLAIASGVSAVVEQQKYERVIVTRPIQPFGNDIGYLPGTLQEKMAPWVAPIFDNLDVLFSNDSAKAMMETYIDRGLIRVEAMPYIRGRSIPSSFIIVDEAQNLTTSELKTIITRAGEGTKVVLTGDVQQIDKKFLDPVTDGIVNVIEKLKNNSLCAHVSLDRIQRSPLADLAVRVL
jgi:PhoH-like ATPase